jgi:hypothetical protein
MTTCRWGAAAATTAAAAMVAIAAGCGGAGGAAVSVPAAGGAPLVDRVLGPGDLGIPGYTASREPVVAQGLPGPEAADPCAPRRDVETRDLRENGFQATARRAYEADRGGAVSAVWQFASTTGAARAERAFVLHARLTFPGCDAGIRRTGHTEDAVPGLPGGMIAHDTQTGPDGPGEAWNAYFRDGRFVYLVGAAGPPGRATEAGVLMAANRAWARRDG